MTTKLSGKNTIARIVAISQSFASLAFYVTFCDTRLKEKLVGALSPQVGGYVGAVAGASVEAISSSAGGVADKFFDRMRNKIVRFRTRA